MNISMTREAILEALERQLKLAKAEDEGIKKQHEKEEQAALAKFRATLKDAMTWDYKRVKNRSYDALQLKSPACPRSNAEPIARAIQHVTLDTRSRFVAGQGSDLHQALTWLPESKRPKKSICE